MLANGAEIRGVGRVRVGRYLLGWMLEEVLIQMEAEHKLKALLFPWGQAPALHTRKLVSPALHTGKLVSTVTKVASVEGLPQTCWSVMNILRACDTRAT